MINFETAVFPGDTLKNDPATVGVEKTVTSIDQK